MATANESSSRPEAFSRVLELVDCVKDKLSIEHSTNTIVRSALAEISKLTPSLHNNIKQNDADQLDEHGVRLWNASITLRQLSEGNASTDSFIADVRLAAVRLLDAGSSTSMDNAATVRLAMAYSSLLSLLSATGSADQGAVLSRTQQLASLLPSADEHIHDKGFSDQLGDVRRTFSCARFDMTFTAGDYSQAESHLSALIDDLHPSTLSISKGEPIWRRCFQLGQHFLGKLSGSNGPDNGGGEQPTLDESATRDCHAAVKWLQKGITIQERAGVVGLPVIKALVQLAYAYFVAGALDKGALTSADAALSEASKMLQAAQQDEPELSEYIAFLKYRVTCRQANDTDIARALERLCSSVTLKESTMCRLLDIVSNGPKRLLPVGFRIIIRAMLGSDQPDAQQSLTAVVLRAIFLLTEPATLAQLDSMLDDVANSKMDLSQDAVCAAQMMIWRKGDVLYKKEMLELAADVHMIAVHRAFSSMPDNVAKSARRIAVCYLGLHQPEAAKACVDLCPEPYRHSAATQLCSFLASLQMGNEEEALSAFHKLVKAPDLDPSLLVEVVEEAQKANMEKILHAGLETLMDAIKVDSHLQASVDLLALHRTLVSIFLPPGDDKTWPDNHAQQLELYLRQALKALASRMDADEDARKHAEWFWKQAFNAGVTASHTKDADLAAGIFDAAFDLMEERHRFTGDPPDEAIIVASWCAKFASVEVATAGILDVEEGSGRQAMYQELQRQFELAEKLRQAAHAVDAEAAPDEAEWALVLLAFKLSITMKDWAGLSRQMTALEEHLSRVPFKVTEALVQALNANAETTVPAQAHVQVLELMLKRHNLESSEQTVDRTLRYYRFLLMCLLEDEQFSQKEYRRKALDCLAAVRDALAAAEKAGTQEFPIDDVMWFLSQAWQKGMELSLMAKIENAKLFSELALSLSRFIPFPEVTRRKMEVQYEALLRRSNSAKSDAPYPAVN